MCLCQRTRAEKQMSIVEMQPHSVKVSLAAKKMSNLSALINQFIAEIII